MSVVFEAVPDLDAEAHGFHLLAVDFLLQDHVAGYSPGDVGTQRDGAGGGDLADGGPELGDELGT